MLLCCMSLLWMFYTEGLYAECLYAECLYAECHYAECNYGKCPNAECRYLSVVAPHSIGTLLYPQKLDKVVKL
jgi:hypothetical protein